MKILQITVSITAIVYNAGRKAEILDKFCVWAPSIIKMRSKNLLKSLFAAVIQWIPLVSLLTWHIFKHEPQLSGVMTITHFVRDDVVIILAVFF